MEKELQGLKRLGLTIGNKRAFIKGMQSSINPALKVAMEKLKKNDPIKNVMRLGAQAAKGAVPLTMQSLGKKLKELR
jgi:hypothetical protein|tara:strand:- start:87 stop:317 length:231 start_codon:yes stop_codon:yes gene_type:complete